MRPLEVAARTGLPAVLPRVFSDSEQGQIEMLLGEAMSRGTDTVLVGNIGHIRWRSASALPCTAISV